MRSLLDVLLLLSTLNRGEDGKSLTTATEQIYPNTTYPGYTDPNVVEGALSFETSPPEYPSPWMNPSEDWAEAYAKAKDFVSQLTLMEKVNLTTGVG